MPGATDFNNGTNKILKHSRLYVCWIAAGLCQGVYDNVIRYASNRKQFNKPISGTDLLKFRIPTRPRKNSEDYGKYPGCFLNVLQNFKVSWRGKGFSWPDCYVQSIRDRESSRSCKVGKINFWRKWNFAWWVCDEGICWCWSYLHIWRNLWYQHLGRRPRINRNSSIQMI